MIVTSTKKLAKETKSLFRELPYNGFNFIDFHGQFNNSLRTNLPTKKYLERLTSLHDLNLFNLNIDSNANPDLNIQPIQCKYYSPHSFSQSFQKQSSALSNDSQFSFLHNNVKSLRRNLENFHLLDELQLHFNVIGVTETKSQISISPLISIHQYQTIILNTYLRLSQLEVWVCTLTTDSSIQLLKKPIIKISRLFVGHYSLY